MVIDTRKGDQVQYSAIWKIPDMNSDLRIFRKEIAERFSQFIQLYDNNYHGNAVQRLHGAV